jgi:hypothetical protein
VCGEVLFCHAADLDTDGIFSGVHTYKVMTDLEMADVVMENYDPLFASKATAGDILVGGENFGCGSSREQVHGMSCWCRAGTLTPPTLFLMCRPALPSSTRASK